MMLRWKIALALPVVLSAQLALAQSVQRAPLAPPTVRQPVMNVKLEPRTSSVRSPEKQPVPIVRSPADDFAIRADSQLLDDSAKVLFAQRVADAIGKRLDGNSIGYSVTVVLYDGTYRSKTGGLARSQPDSGQRGWKSTDRLSIASVSKMITAAAVRKALLEKNIPLDAKAWKYLPAGWTFGDNFKAITIEELLAHKSGVRSVDGCDIYFDSLKQCAENGVKLADKTFQYDNANYAFMRLILPALYGNTSTSAADLAAAYVWLVNNKVLQPSGIGTAGCKPASGNALSYESSTDNSIFPGNAGALDAVNFDFSSVKAGTDWGDNTLYCGSQGWNLSSEELAKFAWALNQSSNIMPLPASTVMRTQNLGMFHREYSDGYSANGHTGWHPAAWGSNSGEVNAWAATIHRKNMTMSVGLIINSRYRGSYEAAVIDGIKEIADAN